MNDHDQGIKSLQEQVDEAPIWLSLPKDYGLPANATIAQRRSWQRQELFLAAFSVLGSVAVALRRYRDTGG